MGLSLLYVLLFLISSLLKKGGRFEYHFLCSSWIYGNIGDKKSSFFFFLKFINSTGNNLWEKERFLKVPLVCEKS